MRIRTYAICLYIIMIYWISLHIPYMHSLFFPTLGAFSLLFISRPFEKSQLRKIALGAVFSSFIGSILNYWNPGVLSLLLTLLIVIFCINRFNWNAPPILAVALIPFFTQPTLFWAIPLSVCGSLLGLLVTLSAAVYIEKRFESLPSLLNRIVKTESDSVN
ncbi:HPP family protein [Bacillus sp. FJAT-28004]|uniref:HPP family protein n=1 Tax=Bacillus sp. FJAT-28004 TaxID=1679165 RepID=UPI0006B65A40|nr:HPP family protein [Bacillus sp. FJAT-28004]